MPAASARRVRRRDARRAARGCVRRLAWYVARHRLLISAIYEHLPAPVSVAPPAPGQRPAAGDPARARVRRSRARSGACRLAWLRYRRLPASRRPPRTPARSSTPSARRSSTRRSSGASCWRCCSLRPAWPRSLAHRDPGARLRPRDAPRGAGAQTLTCSSSILVIGVVSRLAHGRHRRASGRRSSGTRSRASRCSWRPATPGSLAARGREPEESSWAGDAARRLGESWADRRRRPSA